MIDIEEFKVGNYLRHVDEEEFVFITEIWRNQHPFYPDNDEEYHFFTNKHAIGYCVERDFNPIEINSRILRHCGFRRDHAGGWYISSFNLEGGESGLYRPCSLTTNMKFNRVIRYFHELQNSYYLLTKKKIIFDNYTTNQNDAGDGNGE